MADVVLTILAHPDDAEFLCAGTLIRLVREHGFEAHLASMTPGDCGSMDRPPDEISRTRRSEAATLAFGRREPSPKKQFPQLAGPVAAG